MSMMYVNVRPVPYCLKSLGFAPILLPKAGCLTSIKAQLPYRARPGKNSAILGTNEIKVT